MARSKIADQHMWKTYESGFRIVIAFRHELPYFQLSGSHFSRFWRPAGKQWFFRLIATASSSKPSKTCNPLLLARKPNLPRSPMSAYVYQMGVSLVEAKGSDADINIKTGDPEFIRLEVGLYRTTSGADCSIQGGTSI